MSTSNKLTYLNGTKQLLKDKINNLGGSIDDNTTFREYANQLQNVYDNYPKTEYQEGTLVTLENCNKGKLDFDNGVVGIGQIEQESTNGYQLIDISTSEIKSQSNITASKDGDVISINGTANALGILAEVSNFIMPESGNTYTFKVILEGGEWTAGQIGFRLLSSGGTQLYASQANYSQKYIVQQASYSGTPTKFQIYFTSTSAFNNAKIRLLLTLGDDTTKSFEPYTGGQASPNPSYPQTINSVTGNQDVVVSGKNLFNKSSSPVSNNGTSVTELATGIRASVTTAGSNKYSAIKIPNPSELLGKTLTISGKIEASASNNGLVRFYWLNNNTLTDLIASTISGTGGNNTFSISASFPSGSNGIAIVFSSNANGTSSVGDYVDYTDIILEEGSTATTYEPYHTPTTYPISLGNNKFYSIGNYKDELIYDVDNDKVYKNEKIKEINIDGTQGSFSKPNTNRFNIDGIITDYKKLYGAILCMSNYYKAYAQRNTNDEFNADVVNTNYAIELTSNAVANAIRIKDTRYDDITQYQTWLSNNIITFYYVLATPVETEITDTNLHNQVKALYNAHSLNGTTIITSNGNLPMIIKVRALKGE